MKEESAFIFGKILRKAERNVKGAGKRKELLKKKENWSECGREF